MAIARFWTEHLPATGQLKIDGAEAKHIQSVLRMVAGDPIVAFDGRGGEADCRIAEVRKREVLVDVVSRTDTDCELPCSIEVAVALPKGDRQRLLVDGLVQLGITRLVPLVCTRGVAQPSGGAIARLERFALEASKQCGRNTLMEIAASYTVAELADKMESAVRIVAHPYGDVARIQEVAKDAVAENATGRAYCCAVGPEGGFTDDEVNSLTQSGWQAVGLGPRILRVEMAAILLASVLATSVDQCDSQP